MNKLTHNIDRGIALLRKGFLALASDQGLYLFAAFLFATIFNSSLFMWYQERVSAFNSYVIIPWGVVLCVLRLTRADERELRKADTGLLTLLFFWIVIPFWVRFGLTHNNVVHWYAHMVTFFAIYAMNREDTTKRRGAMLDKVCACFAVFSFVLGSMLLYTAVTGKTFGDGSHDRTFGVYRDILRPGYDRNAFAMYAQCCVMMCFVGMNRRKCLLTKMLYFVPGMMMLITIALCQSRTSRYAILAGLAVGVYGFVVCRVRQRHVLCRHAIAALCAVIMFVAGYKASNMLIRRTVEYYHSGKTASLVAVAVAEETAAEAVPVVQGNIIQGMASVNDRMKIWSNLIDLWKENPKYMIIGHGTGRTGSLIVHGTFEESFGTVAVHNGYLQVIADIGLIGAAMMFAFFGMVFVPALRVFFADKEKTYPGGRMLFAMVVAALITSLMESQPLCAMTPMNMMLFYALAILCAEGQSMKKA